MAAASTRPSQLSDEELEDVLRLAQGADTVELKLTIPDLHHRSTVAALGIDPLDAQIRQVFFFDTPELALDASGLVVRARRVQNREHDTVVKLRPVVPEDLPKKMRDSPSMVVEVDAMPGGYVCSASLKRQLGKVDAKEAVAGSIPLRKLFSKRQRAFFAEHAPVGLGLDQLSVLGPIFVLKLNFVPEDFDQKLVAEMWLYPNGSRILELSTKCPPNEMFQVAAESRAFLTSRGVDLSGKQQTKTRTALRFFAERAGQG
ncbi:MAG TPA: hypothetical protein VJL85_01130 [Gaiellaceae bacterium]|nr:hypothetical protein [Gaiellaceae bacterium]